MSDDVRLERRYADLQLGDLVADGTFTGYASVFGRPDLGREIVERGAFARSLARRGAAGIRMLFQHDANQPIGAWSVVEEDARGLKVEGRLALGVARAREVHDLMRAGALDGLSIGFRTARAKLDAKSGIRRIIEADLWEISVVTFPMQPGARVDGWKSMQGALPTTREFERWLMRDARLTRKEARHVIARGFASLRRGRDAATGPAAELAERIRRAARTINLKEDMQ